MSIFNTDTHSHAQAWLNMKIFFRPLIFLQPLDLQEHKVLHLKDLINFSLELEAQGGGMTFNVHFDASKYPYFISYHTKANGLGLKWMYLFYCGCSIKLFLTFGSKPELQQEFSYIYISKQTKMTNLIHMTF